MRQFFYLVSFAYEDESGSSAFDLGVFSSLALAKKKIESSKNLSGFSDYSEQNFLITPIGVEVKDFGEIIRSIIPTGQAKERSFMRKNVFFQMIKEDTENFVKTYHRGESYLNCNKIGEFNGIPAAWRFLGL